MQTMSSRGLRHLMLIAAFVLALSWDASAVAFNGKDVSAQNIGGALSLTDHHGQRRTLADFRGKAVLIFFGYTHCPDVCPTTLMQMAEVVRVLGADAAKVQVLWVTVDPERDTQELLGNYIPAFNSAFLGLRGTDQETKAVADAFKVRYDIVQYKDEILVDNSSFGYLIDPKGRTRVKIDYDMSAAKIAQDVRTILRGG